MMYSIPRAFAALPLWCSGFRSPSRPSCAVEALDKVQGSGERLGLLLGSFKASSLENDDGVSGHLKKCRKTHLYNAEVLPVTPTPRRKNQEDGCKFKGSLSYREEKNS